MSTPFPVSSEARAACRTIVFAHANGFPAGCYRQLFEPWRAAGFRVLAPPRLGHDARFPVTDNWPRLRDELLDFIEREAAVPAFLVGHSLGGFLSVMAASQRPDLAAGVVLLDAPIVGGLLAQGVRLFKATGLGRRFSPGQVSRRRREHWPDADAAHAHFAAKPAFARWAPGVLADYMACGVVPVAPGGDGNEGAAAAGRTLAFHRDVETAIYETLPHHLSRELRRRPLRCPAAFVGGRQSTEVRRVGLAATLRFTHRRVSWIDGTHLFPFERPASAAAHTLDWLRAFSGPADA